MLRDFLQCLTTKHTAESRRNLSTQVSQTFSGGSDLFEKTRENLTAGPPVVFTRKAVTNETFIEKPNKLCISIVGVDVSQLFPYSMCQNMRTGLYTRCGYM